MADGRKIPYLIELAADDKKIRQQMTKINWEELLGSKGKGFGDVLVSDAKDAKDQIKRTLGGLDIDWSKILGAKEIGQLEQAVTKALSKSRKEIELFAASGDTTGLEKTIKYVSALGEELKGLGSNFDAAGLARSMTAFMKVLTPLATKIEALADEPKKVEAAFDRLFSGKTSDNMAKVAGGFTVIGDAAGRAAVKVNKSIETMEEKLASIDAMLSEDYGKKFKFDTDLEDQFYSIDEAIEKVEKNIKQLSETFNGMSSSDKDFDKTRIQLVQLYTEQIELYRKLELVDEEYTRKYSKDASLLRFNAIDPKAVIGEVRETIETIVGDAKRQMQSITASTKTTKDGINIPIKLPSQVELVKTINKYVKSINDSDAIHGVRLKLDSGWLNDAANVIEDKTTRAYGDTPADFDKNTTDLVKKTEERFSKIAKVIGDKQQGILKTTSDWRANMIAAMSIKDKDLEFQFGVDRNVENTADALFNKLQEYFERPEYALDIKFNTEKIARDLKASLEAESIELGVGGGIANIDANSLMSMLHSLLYGGVPVHTPAKPSDASDSFVPKDVADETDEAIDSGKEYVKVLDETTLHIDKVIESLRVFAREANKANASKGSKAIASRLLSKGIDVSKIAKDTSDAQILKMIQEGIVRIEKDKDGNDVTRRYSLMAKDEMGKPQGGSLVGEIRGIMSANGMDAEKGTGKVAEILARDIMELFDINEIETELEAQVEKRFKQLNLWQGVEKPGRALAALGNVRSTKNKVRLPEMQAIDDAINYFEDAGEDTDALKKLKDARKKFEDGGQTDEAKAEFEKSALAFYDETKDVFKRLKARWGDFKGTVSVEGRKPVLINPKGAYPSRILEIPKDAVITKVEPFEAFEVIDGTGHVGSSARRESSVRKAEQQQKQLGRGFSGQDFLVPKPHPKKDVRYEDIEYDTFKTQESERLPQEVALDATIESLEKRAAEIPELVERIEESKKNIAQLEGIKQQIESEISNLQVQDLPEFQMSTFEQYSKRDRSVTQILKDAKSSLTTNSELDAIDVSKLDKDQQSLVNRLQALTTNIHNDSMASQEFANKIAEIVEAKRLSNEELEIARSKAAEQKDKTRVDLYSDLLFDRASVDRKLESYQSQKNVADKNIGENKTYAQKLIKELEASQGQSADRATKEAETLAAQLVEAKDRLYTEAKTYADILNNSSTDDKTRETALGKLQETLQGLGQITSKFATIQAYVPQSTLYNSSQQNNVDKWNKKYTNKEVSKLEKELKTLENQLKNEEDEAKIAELKKKIANTKRNLTRLKKSVPDNVSSRKRTELTNIERQLSEEQSKLTADENRKRAADEASSDLQSTKQDAAFLTKYNELLEKEKSLLEEVNKLKREGADKSVIEGKTDELEHTTKETDKFLKEEASSVGKLETKLNTLEKQLKDEKDEAKAAELKTEITNTKNQLKRVKERIAYAREAAVEYQAQLHTAYRKRSVFDNQIQGLNDDEENLTKYGLSGRVGSKARRLALRKASDAYMASDEVRAQEEAIRKNEQLSWEQRDKQLKELRQKLREEFAKRFDDTNVQQDELDRIATERAIAEAGREPLDDIIKDLQSQKKAAMRYGAISDDDLKNDKYLKQNEQYHKNILDLQSDRVKLERELESIKSDDSLDEKKQEKAIKSKQKEIDSINQEIQRNQALIDNRVKLMELHKQEKEESKQTPEEKALLATEKLVGMKQSLAQAEEKVAARKADYESAKGTENEIKMLEALDKQIKKRDQIQGQIANTEKKIERLGKATQKTEDAQDEVASAVEDTTSGKASGGLLGIIKEAVGEASVGNVDLTKVEEILSKILAVLSGNGIVGTTRSSEMDAKLARIKELEAKQQLANEQKKTAETVKQVENAKKETAESTNVADTKAHKNVSKTQVYKDVQKSVDAFRTSELTADKEPLNAIKLALDELSKINDKNSQEYIEWQRKLGSALAAYGKKNGIENGRGYYDKVYAELEKNGVAIDPKLPITNKSGISSALVEKGLVTIKEKEAKAKQSEAKAEEKITEEKKEQEQIRFTRKEKKELNRLKSEVKDYNPDDTTGTGSEFGGFATENTLRAILEVLNKISTSGVPKSGGKSKTTTPSNTNDPIPDEASEEVDELTAKIDKLKVKFADAMKVGYLGKKDTGLKDFEKQLKKIDKALAEGKSVEKLEQMRQKAIALGDVVNTTIAGNKRKYSGTAEMGAATRQRDNMEARGVLDYADLKMVQDYKQAYGDLMTQHRKFATKGTLYDPDNQKTLQNMAIKVKDLGKQLEKSVAEAEQLQQLVDNSGMHNGKQMGGVHQLTAEEMGNVEASMKSYLQSLNLGNLEHVKFDHTHQKLTATLRTSNKTVADLEVKYNEATGALYAYQKAERESLTGVPAFLNGFKKKFNSIMQYLSMTMSIHQVLAELRKGVQYVREIDLALTELKKVTDETEEAYDKFLDTAAKTGARLGTTISAVTEATATFAKLGYSMEQATEMAESAIVYKNVGDNIASTEDAADSIISTMKGFRLEASESMRIVDRFNEVGNRFAITSQGIGEALRLSASALSEGGNSLDESIGLITAANEVVNDPSSVGTALKTLTLRLRGSKTELEEMGEDITDMATTTSQLQAKLLALTGGQVDIMANPTTFKNSTQILREMAEAWKDMDDLSRASALELMGGKRQANVLSALIQNFDTVEKAIETSANSAGSALKENERYLDSIQGKIDQFNNATQSMWSDTFDSDLVKWVVGLGTELIKIVDAIGLIPSILVAILTYKLAVGAVKMFDLTSLGTYIGMLFTANSATEVQGLLINKTALAQKLLNSTLIQAQAARMGLTAADLAGYSVTQLLTLGIKGLAAGFKNLWIAMGPVGWAILAIVGAATAFTLIFNAVHKTTEELAEELSNLKAELQDIESEIDSLNSELKTTKERMAELIAMPSLSFVEQEELANLQRTTAELERQLTLKKMLGKNKEDAVLAASEKYVDRVWNGKNADKSYTVDDNGVIKEDGFFTWGVDAQDALVTAMEKYSEKAKAENARQDLLANWDDINWEDIDKETSDKLEWALNGYELKGDYYVGKAADVTVDMWKEKLEGTTSYQSAMDDIADGINMVFADENFDNLKYGMSEDIDAFLDEMYAYQYKWQKTQGIDSTSSAIAAIFDDTSSESIKKLKEDLMSVANDSSFNDAQKQAKGLQLVRDAINSTAGDYDRLKTSMDIIGISANEVAGYFVQLSKAPDSSTVEGLTAQYQKGVDALDRYTGKATDIIAEFTNLDGTVEKITWGSLFDDNGEPIDVQIAKVLQGSDETVRTEFSRIAKAVNEGKMSVDNAMKSFSVSGVQAGYKLLESAVVEINSDIFKDLGDEISGLIDTFEEFGSALESVANSIELVNQAQAEMAYSGHISVETALNLIDSTENWNEVLEIEHGQIKLLPGAMATVAQAKLNQVKTNLQLALSEAQAGLEQARLAESGEEVAKTLEESTTESVRQLAANMTYLSTLIGEFLDGNFFGAHSAAKSAKADSLKATEYQKTSPTSSMSVADWEEKVSNIESKLSILEGVDTVGEFENNYYSDKVSGGNGTEKEVVDDAFQREMTYWENRIGANQARYEQLQNEIDLLEAKGQKADASYYSEQMMLENERLWLLGEQKKAAQAHLKTLTEGSEEWWEVANTLNDIEGEIDSVTASLVDLQDAIGEIDTYKFEEFHKRLDDITSKLETIRNLVAPDGEEDWFDDEGNWTEKGVAVLGSYIQELETYKQGLAEITEQSEKYSLLPYAGNVEYYETLGIHSEQEYYDKMEELIDQQYSYAESISDTKQSIADMYESNIDAVEEYTETLIDNYNDYIDSVKEALDAERDLYDFKKNVQKQSKDIAAIERRIASLSGSTNASDVAERRKLEAELYESRESLNDTYYDHARSSQDEALDAEATAYEESMTKFVEGLRTSLEQATLDMDTFLGDVTTMVSLNAGIILTEYKNTGLELDPALTAPWEAAKTAVGNYSGDALDLMNKWTQGGFFTTFPETVKGSLTSPWSAGSTAANAFKTSVDTVMEGVVSNISTNVKTASGELSKLYQQIKDTEKRAAEAEVVVDPPTSPPTYTPISHDKPISPAEPTQLRGLMKTSKEMILGPKSFVDANTETINGTKYYRDSKTGYYYKISDLNSKRKYDGNRTTGWAIPKGTWFYTKHAKGTTGTDRDEWAITDEPQFGDELVLVPGKDGNLSFMRKGTGVVPADLTQKLFELAQIPTSDLMSKSLTAVVPNITKNDFKNEFNFESLVHVDAVDSDTLPKLEKMVDKKIDDFSKALNYSLKRFAR